jgi:hypothetical protein
VETEEITIQVERDEEPGWLVASWDDPMGGGITTQGQNFEDLQHQISDAVAAHFDEVEAPRRMQIRLRR